MDETEKEPIQGITMAESSSKEYSYHWEDSEPILFGLHTPESYPPTTTTYKTIILYHSGGLVSANRHMIPAPVMSSLHQKGWLVISPDFHLLPESSLQDVHNDAEGLENWLLKNYNEIGVDLEHLAIGGAGSGKWSRLWKADKSSHFYNN